MDINQALVTMHRKATLSTLWIVVFLNMIFRDIHEIVLPRFTEEMLAGPIPSDELMLVAGIALSIMISMILFARILPYRFNRPANIIIAIFMILSIVANGTNDLDDIWFLAIEIIGLVSIIAYAWRWSKDSIAMSPAVA